MTSPRQISIPSLDEAVSQVLSRVVDQYGQTPVVRHDAYWAIPAQERFDMSTVPAPTVGQFTEELDHLGQVLADPDLPPSITLVWLGRLMECLGAELLADDVDESTGTVS